MKVLVTGARGMLGQSVTRALEAADHQVLGLSHSDADVTRLDSLRHPIRAFAPDWVFHLAAFTRVDDCEARPDDAYLVNALGSRNAALAAAEAGAAVLAISSDYVFDGTARTPYREYDAPNPKSAYGASKLAGEIAVREVYTRHAIVRTSWLFGRGGPNFIDAILRKARAGEPLRVVDDQHGAPTSTHDLAAALIRIAESGQYGTYHCTNDGECTWYDLAVYALRRAELSVSIDPIDTATLARPAPRPAYSVLSNLLYRHVTGASLPTWQEAVDRHVRASAARAASATAEREGR